MWPSQFVSIFETFILVADVGHKCSPNLFHRSFFESWQNPHDFALDLFVYVEARSKNLDVFRFPVKFGIDYTVSQLEC